MQDSPIELTDWGLIPYADALQRQTDLVQKVYEESCEERLIFCSHPPVVTVGRATQTNDVYDWDGELIEVSRGGRATYHGPNQILMYPILNLKLRGKDVHFLLRALEEICIRTLRELSVEADRRADATGVWLAERKLASIGIAVRHWISFHGLALNYESDPQAFRGLRPCGFASETMISLREVLGEKLPSRTQMIERMQYHFFCVLNATL